MHLKALKSGMAKLFCFSSQKLQTLLNLIWSVHNGLNMHTFAGWKMFLRVTSANMTKSMCGVRPASSGRKSKYAIKLI